jgi:hypothetical protein
MWLCRDWAFTCGFPGCFEKQVLDVDTRVDPPEVLSRCVTGSWQYVGTLPIHSDQFHDAPSSPCSSSSSHLMLRVAKVETMT